MGKKYQVLADSVVMTDTPEMIAEATTELLFGERVEVIGRNDDEWVKCRSLRDGYEGYLPRGELDDELHVVTHKICALRGFAYSDADYKSPPVRSLSFMSPLSVDTEEDGYALLMQGGWVPLQHITAVNAFDTDIISCAKMFVGTPYLWGGRTSIGLDCSALVQLCLLNAGIDCPRDSKDQAEAIGREVAADDIKAGDIVFFDGHVGMMIDEAQIINATARHMGVVIEDLDAVSDAYGGIKCVRRVL